MSSLLLTSVATAPVPSSPSKAAALPHTPIPTIQGTGPASPLTNQAVSTAGVITAIQQSKSTPGFYLQDPEGDGKTSTSDGVFVSTAHMGADLLSTLNVGAKATVTGTVLEHYQQTIIDASAVKAAKRGRSLIQPTPLTVPRHPTDRAKWLEAHEGMLMTLPESTVLGPSQKFGITNVVDAAIGGRRSFKPGDLPVGPIALNDMLDRGAKFGTGDRIAPVSGPLAFTYGKYALLPTEKPTVSLAAPTAPKMWGDLDGDDVINDGDLAAIKARIGTTAHSPLDPADLNGDGRITRSDLNAAAKRAAAITGAPSFTVATMNAENFFDTVDAPPPITDGKLSGPAYQRKLTKLASTIVDKLASPELLAMQEVENTGVLDDLLKQPELKDLNYQYVLLPTSGKRSINPALLYRADSVKVSNPRQWQQNAKTGEDALLTAPLLARRTGAAQVSVAGPLFAREPLVVDVSVERDGQQRDLTMVINHLISKYSPWGSPTEPLRIEQAKFIRQHVAELREHDPTREVLVVGDLNDTPGSKPIKALTSSRPQPLLSDIMSDHVPKAERYSYVYGGQSQQIDHILATDGLATSIERAGFRHGNADVPDSVASDMTTNARASDHDPAYAVIRFSNHAAAGAAL